MVRPRACCERFESSVLCWAEAAARSRAKASRSRSASASASGESGIVSSEEIDGERERNEDGVDGMDEIEAADTTDVADGCGAATPLLTLLLRSVLMAVAWGYASLYLAGSTGEGAGLRSAGDEALVCKVPVRPGLWRWRCSGDEGRRRGPRGKVPCAV